MAGTYLNIPFDNDLFVDAWQEAPDPTKLALINSGVLVEDPIAADQLQNKGNLYTLPFYDALAGDEVNYDGATDITATEASGSAQTGIAYGRAKAFTARNFVAELSGSDPFGHIVNSVARYWNKKRQSRIIGLLDGIFSLTGDSDWLAHTVDLTSETATASKIEENTINDAATATLGDNKGLYSVAIMHSAVAKTLEDLQLLEFWKQTDANGIQRPMSLASCNGFTVIVDDSVPHSTVGGSGANKDLMKYTTYLLGTGVLRTAPGRVDVPVEVTRDALKNGGQDTLVTRIRETIHPNGFSFTVPSSGWTESPTDAQLFNKSNWSRKFEAKAIPMCKIITNG